MTYTDQLISLYSLIDFVYLEMGFYMFIESSSPRVKGDTASLLSQPFFLMDDVCLTFFYNMYGAGMGSLNVTVQVCSRNAYKVNIIKIRLNMLAIVAL